MSDKVCPLPFHQIYIKPDGRILPCCYFDVKQSPEDLNVANPNFINHPFLEKLRNDMIAGKHHTGCSKCYVPETGDLIPHSYRNESILNHYKSNGKPFAPPYTAKITGVEIAMSNLCNSRCRMCHPDLSTNWYPDAKALGIPYGRTITINQDAFAQIDFSHVVQMKILGGEPLLEQEKLKDILHKCNRSNLTITIITNLTIRPDSELVSLLKECKKVTWSCSIDAVGPLNDFIRKGSKWSDIEDNLAYFVENFKGSNKTNSFVSVRSVVNIYNINCFMNMHTYLKNKYPGMHHIYDMTYGPQWMELQNLPDPVKQLALERIRSTPQHFALTVIQPQLLRQMMEFTNGNFDNFKEMDQKLNNLRNETWYDLNPELYSWLKPYL